MIFYEDDLSEIGIDRELDATYMIFKKNVSSQDFIDVHKKVIDLFNGIDEFSGKHLVDTSKLKTVSLEGQKWVAEHVVPVIHKKGNREKVSIAIILSDDVFAQFAVQNISKKVDEISDNHFFNTTDEAKKWLSAQ